MIRFFVSFFCFLFLQIDLQVPTTQGQSLQKCNFEGIVCFDIVFGKEEMNLPDAILPSMEVIAKDNAYLIHILGDFLQIYNDGSDSTIVISTLNLKDNQRYCTILPIENPESIQYYQTNDTMEICGYRAQKSFFYAETNQILEVWTTNQLCMHINQYLIPGLEGFPLSFYLYFQGRYLKVQASEIRREPIPDELIKKVDNCMRLNPDDFLEMISENE